MYYDKNRKQTSMELGLLGLSDSGDQVNTFVQSTQPVTPMRIIRVAGPAPKPFVPGPRPLIVGPQVPTFVSPSVSSKPVITSFQRLVKSPVSSRKVKRIFVKKDVSKKTALKKIKNLVEEENNVRKQMNAVALREGSNSFIVKKLEKQALQLFSKACSLMVEHGIGKCAAPKTPILLTAWSRRLNNIENHTNRKVSVSGFVMPKAFNSLISNLKLKGIFNSLTDLDLARLLDRLDLELSMSYDEDIIKQAMTAETTKIIYEKNFKKNFGVAPKISDEFALKLAANRGLPSYGETPANIRKMIANKTSKSFNNIIAEKAPKLSKLLRDRGINFSEEEAFELARVGQKSEQLAFSVGLKFLVPKVTASFLHKGYGLISGTSGLENEILTESNPNKQILLGKRLANKLWWIEAFASGGVGISNEQVIRKIENKLDSNMARLLVQRYRPELTRMNKLRAGVILNPTESPFNKKRAAVELAGMIKKVNQDIDTHLPGIIQAKFMGKKKPEIEISAHRKAQITMENEARKQNEIKQAKAGRAINRINQIDHSISVLKTAAAKQYWNQDLQFEVENKIGILTAERSGLKKLTKKLIGGPDVHNEVEAEIAFGERIPNPIGFQ